MPSIYSICSVNFSCFPVTQIFWLWHSFHLYSSKNFTLKIPFLKLKITHEMEGFTCHRASPDSFLWNLNLKHSRGFIGVLPQSEPHSRYYHPAGDLIISPPLGLFLLKGRKSSPRYKRLLKSVFSHTENISSFSCVLYISSRSIYVQLLNI